MQNIFESISNTSDKAVDIGEKYIKDTQEYYKLKVFQHLTSSVSMIAKAAIIGGVLFIGLIFLATAVAIAIGDWVNSRALGYLIVSILFITIGAILYSNRTVITNKVIIKFSPKFFNSES